MVHDHGVTLRTIEKGLFPSAEDVTFYREHGYWAAPVILDDDLLDDAVHGAERYYAGERDAHLPLSGGFLDWRAEHGNVLRLNDYTSLQCDELRALVEAPIVGAVAARLCGSPSVRLFHDQLICKPPGLDGDVTAIGWHTDKAYWMTCTSGDMLTAWIPLQDCTEEMGPITVIDGSHRWPDTDGMSSFNDRDLARFEQRLEQAGRALQKVPLVLRRGQVSFHHCRTIHGSLPNRSRQRRLALTVHIQDQANRYRPHVDPRGKATLHINDLLCRRGLDGQPDYADPEICPVLWDERTS